VAFYFYCLLRKALCFLFSFWKINYNTLILLHMYFIIGQVSLYKQNTSILNTKAGPTEVQCRQISLYKQNTSLFWTQKLVPMRFSVDRLLGPAFVFRIERCSVYTLKPVYTEPHWDQLLCSEKRGVLFIQDSVLFRVQCWQVYI
jgi:hypothetical protein